jgi:plastocyanin
VIFILAACTGSSKQDVVESEGLVLTGSVGDGPIVGAEIRVEDAEGELVFEGISDETANYNFEIPDGTLMPVTVRVGGGTDLVTSRPADFEMQSVAFESGPVTLNVSPYTTLAVKTARCLGEINPDNLNAAWDLIDRTINLGWARERIDDPMGESIDTLNINTILMSNEALGELIRRSADDLSASSTPLTTDEVLDHLACDIANGALDGIGGDSDTRVGLTMAANATAIGLEVLAGTLRVDGEDAIDRLDNAMRTILPEASGSVLDMTPPQSLIDQTVDRLGIFVSTESPEILNFALALEQATPSTARGQVAAVADVSALGAIDALADEIAQADPASLEPIVARQADQAAAPRISFAADAAVVSSGASTRLSWATSDAESCLASGGWSGEQAVSGSAQTGPLTSGTEFALSCAGRGGVVTERTFVAVQATVPEPRPEPNPEPAPEPEPAPVPEPEPVPAPEISFNADRTSVDAGDSVQLSWTTSNASACSASGAWGGSRSVNGSTIVGPLNTNVTFTLNCTGPGGQATASQSINVVQPQPAPTVSLSSAASSVLRGSAITLSWSSTNATSCTASGAWGGNRPLLGNSSTGNLSATSSFTLTCSGPGGTRSDNVTVQVLEPSAPTVSLAASRTSIDEGDSLTLNWSSTDTTSCSASGAWSGSRASSGTSTVGPLTSSSTFTLSCSGDGGSASDSVTVDVTPTPVDPPVVALNLASGSINAGETTTLSWSASNATGCTAAGAWSGSRSTTGSVSVSPNSTSTYSLTCTGDGGSDTASTTLNVSVQAPTLSFGSSEDLIDQGAGVTLSWSATDASSCSASGGWSGSRGTSGSEFISGIDSSTTFTLTCSGAGGNVVEMLTVSTLSGISLNWVAPSENADGSALTDLAGYRIYYGTTSRNYSGMVELNDPADTSHSLSLASGDYYVAMTALDQQGNESAYSNEVLKTAP